MTDSSQNQEKSKSLKWVFLWAGALIIIDALFLNQGVISALIGAWMLLVAVPRAVFFTKAPELKRYRLKRAAVFIGAMAMVFVLNWANNQIARKRASTLIAAVKAFNQKLDRYPAKLEELAPEFIERVPIAKYTLTDNSFRYISTPESHSLFYVSMPPFGRPTYTFERDEWFYAD